MTDIIANAKRLLEDATDGPWELHGGEIYQVLHTPAQCYSNRCDHLREVLTETWGEGGAVGANDEDLALMASAREMAEAIKPEHWWYAVQVYLGKRWIFLGRGLSFNSLEEHACWFTTVEKAKAFTTYGNPDSPAHLYPQRLVRQRRSPVEVIADA